MKSSCRKEVGDEDASVARGMGHIPPVLGRLAWLVVAPFLYAIVWTRFDTCLRFAIPERFGDWLCEFLGVTSPEGRHGVFLWATSILVVSVLHGVGLTLISLARSVWGPEKGAFRRWKERSCSAVGWISSLLVSTGVVVLIGEAIYTAQGGELLPHSAEQDVELFLVFLVMCLLHLAVLRPRHQQRR